MKVYANESNAVKNGSMEWKEDKEKKLNLRVNKSSRGGKGVAYRSPSPPKKKGCFLAISFWNGDRDFSSELFACFLLSFGKHFKKIDSNSGIKSTFTSYGIA